MGIIKRKSKESEQPAPKAHSLSLALDMQKRSKNPAPAAKDPEHVSCMHCGGSGKMINMAMGGEVVDMDENNLEGPGTDISRNVEAKDEEHYDDDQLSPQPIDSNEHGDDIDSDEHDRVSSIRKKMKSKG